MGQLLAKISQLLNRIGARIVMVGLGAAGKTTVLFGVVATIPAIGFNVKRAEHRNLKMTIWDIGGQDRLDQAARQDHRERHPHHRPRQAHAAASTAAL
jgi:GTPase SAR1 family protein